MNNAATSEVRSLLAARAFLFEDANAYMAGVDDALRARRPRSGPNQATTDDAWSGHPLLDGRGVE